MIEADIIMVCWNHLDLTQRAVQSIRDNTIVSYRLIVSDGASTDGTGAWLAEQGDITAIIAETNEGIEPATNRALKISTAPYIALIGNDVEVSRGWLGLLIEGLENNPRVGYISAMGKRAVQSMPDVGTVRITMRPQGTTCVVLRREVIQDVGLFDERFAFAYNGDTDYCYRIKLAGWKFAEHHGVLFRHDPPHGTIGPTGKMSEYVALGKQRLREKWPNVASWGAEWRKPVVTKRALVCGASGFIAGHLIGALKSRGYWVRGVDIKPPVDPLQLDEFRQVDLRWEEDAREALRGGFDEVYQLAASVGGLGYILFEECEVMRDNVLINVNMTHAAAEACIGRYLFASSECVYRNMEIDEPMIAEAAAIPANPDNEYGWEKLYSERIAMAYARRYATQVRTARFKSVYGIGAPWRGGREKVLPALCRKAIEAEDGGELEIWGDGTAIRTETYVTDIVEGMYALMQSDLEGPVNIGSDKRYTINEFADTVIELSGKKLTKKHIDGPIGVQARNFSTERIRSLGWEPKVPLEVGLTRLYNWIEREMGHAS